MSEDDDLLWGTSLRRGPTDDRVQEDDRTGPEDDDDDDDEKEEEEGEDDDSTESPTYLDNGYQKLSNFQRTIMSKAVKAKCLDCSGGNHSEVTKCTVLCPLWPFRKGRNPWRPKRVMSEEQRAAAAERFSQIRKDKT